MARSERRARSSSCGSLRSSCRWRPPEPGSIFKERTSWRSGRVASRLRSSRICSRTPPTCSISSSGGPMHSRPRANGRRFPPLLSLRAARVEENPMSIRPIKRIAQSTPTIEGAGVKLRRAFGFGTTSEFDPFLLLDDFRNENPDDYRAGFPWHPHRGIETITYVLAGTVEHGDSLGNRGKMGAGDVQWMTAGSGILHQEMPQGDAQGRMHGFQLWANLPSSLKMTKPRYQDVPSSAIPDVTDDDGTHVRVICGEFWGKRGPVEGVAADPRYLDVFVPPGKRKTLPVETSRHAFAYVFEGSGAFS